MWAWRPWTQPSHTIILFEFKSSCWILVPFLEALGPSCGVPWGFLGGKRTQQKTVLLIVCLEPFLGSCGGHLVCWAYVGPR